MIWQYSPLVLPLAVSAVMTLVLAAIAWHNRKVPGGVPLTIFLLGATVWSAAYALVLSVADLPSNLLFTYVEYAGIMAVSLAFVLFVISYTGRESLLTRTWRCALLLFPACVFAALLTNDLHHLYYTGFMPVVVAGSIVWVFVHGPLFWVAWIGFAAMTIAAIALLVSHLISSPPVYRTQIRLLLVASLVPLVANLLYVFGMGPVRGLDLTPLSFLVTGLTLEMATIRYRLFSVTPVARSLLPRIMTDGMVVVNEAGVVVDINPAAALIAGMPEEAAIGRPFDQVLPAFARFIAGCPKEAEVEVTTDGAPHIFAVQCQRAAGVSRDLHGHLLVLHDITELRNEQAALRRANEKLNLLEGITRHDTLNLLAGVIGYLDIALESDDPEEIRGYVRKSLDAAGTIRQQMEFAREYQAVGMDRPQWFDLKGVAERALGSARQGGMRTEVAVDGVEVYADPLLERALYNLADNALEHGVEVTVIRISCRTEGERLTIVVEDDGVGVPEGKKEEIFLRGFGKHTGLGLFLVREVLGITGMTIRETGTPGVGARFEIAVPPESFRLRRR
ncbi:MAG: histidine kinase N-terminal 7TM domain-containing protein [Methanofollis sp.]|uniref:sensor histidine kinase n=1 Tax=Methanofollis sp. TaxID=2052835 RepID=UPI00262B30D9|nr:histidine kinase N-terminal 7TM domain-containing protein [Methanofollis sp.]MDD4254139.1 histidine kinase N-terminal 7TM domain-containing protein [Methanofollis sp.]